ncbi:hypothetical protein Bca4012_077526 [Brassica carinata]
MSYLEIYNEDINDLLDPEHGKLQIHENLEEYLWLVYEKKLLLPLNKSLK